MLQANKSRFNWQGIFLLSSGAMRSASDLRRRPGVMRDPILPSKTLTLDSGKWRNLHSRIIAFCANAADASTSITPRRVPHECHHTVGRAIQETESSTERSGLDIFYSTCACRARPGKLDKGPKISGGPPLMTELKGFAEKLADGSDSGACGNCPFAAN